MNILVFNSQYLSCLIFVKNMWDKVGLVTIRIPLWVITSIVFFSISRPMFQRVVNYSGLILLFCCEFFIDEIWYIFTFLCSTMQNSSSTSVLEISAKAQVMVEPHSMILSSPLYSGLLLAFSCYSFVLVLNLAIRLGRYRPLEFNSCP